jgi:hypothetical protein
MTISRIPSVEGGIQPTLLTAKGDLISATAASTVARLAVGSDAQILVADSTASTGLKWATPAAGGSMTLLSTTTLSGAATITISSISQSYTNLYVLATGINVTTATYTLKIRPNAADFSNYSDVSGATVAQVISQPIMPGNAGHSASNANNDLAFTFYNYTDTVQNKPFVYSGVCKMAAQVALTPTNGLGGFASSNAITSISFNNDSGGNFTAGTVKIYGVN